MMKTLIEEYVKSREKVSVPEIQDKFCLDYPTARKIMEQLEEERIIEYKAGITFAVLRPASERTAPAYEYSGLGTASELAALSSEELRELHGKLCFDMRDMYFRRIPDPAQRLRECELCENEVLKLIKGECETRDKALDEILIRINSNYKQAPRWRYIYFKLFGLSEEKYDNLRRRFNPRK